MARRVGFGRGRSNESGREARAEADADAGASPDRASGDRGGDAPPPLMRVVGTAFILLWLGVISYVGLNLSGVIGSESGDVVSGPALIFVLAVVGLGWLFGLRALMRIAQGKPLRNRPARPKPMGHIRPEPDGDR